MYMKNFEVVNLFNYFSNLKLNSFSKKIRSKLIVNFDKLGDIKNKLDIEVDSIKERLFSENLENVQKLILYRKELDTTSEEKKIEIGEKIKRECQPALEIELKLLTEINNLYGQNANVEIDKINKGLFVEECVNAGIDITLSELNAISALFD